MDLGIVLECCGCLCVVILKKRCFAIDGGSELATFSIHFDGAITVDHKVSIRVLAKTYEHMQRAIDRAYLIGYHGEVWKHARLTAQQYSETEFIAEYPRQGGIILDAVRRGAGRVVDRISSAVAPVFESAVQQGFDEHHNLTRQHADRLEYVIARRDDIPSFDQLVQTPHREWSEAYSNRSIVKEVDQLVGQISSRRLEGSTVELAFAGDRPYQRFEFDAPRAKRFHQIVSRRDLAAAVVVNARIRSLDRGNQYTKPNAKILNLSTNREVVLHLQNIGDFDTLHRYHNGEPVRLFVCPIIEALGFDVNGGDLMFVAVA